MGLDHRVFDREVSIVIFSNPWTILHSIATAAWPLVELLQCSDTDGFALCAVICVDAPAPHSSKHTPRPKV